MARSMERSRSRRRSRSPQRHRSPDRSRRRSRSISRSVERSSSRRRRSYSRSSSRGRSRSHRHSRDRGRDRYSRRSSRSPGRSSGSRRRSRSNSYEQRSRRRGSRSPSYSRSRRSQSPRREQRRQSPSPRRYDRREEESYRRGYSRNQSRDEARLAMRDDKKQESVVPSPVEVKAPTAGETETASRPQDETKVAEPVKAKEASATVQPPQPVTSLPVPRPVTEVQLNAGKPLVRRVEFQSPSVNSAESTPISTPSAHQKSAAPAVVIDPVMQKRREYREKIHRAYSKSSVARSQADAKLETVEANLMMAESWLEFVVKHVEDVGRRTELQDWRFKRIDEMDIQELLAPITDVAVVQDPEPEPAA